MTITHEAPKRPVGAFIYFANAKREGVKKAAPDASAADVRRQLKEVRAHVGGKSAGEQRPGGNRKCEFGRVGVWRLGCFVVAQMWDQASLSEKSPFEKTAAQDKKRYEKERENYVPPPKPTKSGKRFQQDPVRSLGRAILWRPPRRDTLRYSPPPVSPCQERPKKPKTAYLYFAESVRPKLLKDNPGLPVPKMAPLISARWKKTADKDKAKFEALAAKDSERCPAPLATSALPPPATEAPGRLAQAQEGARELQALRILPPVPRGVA